MKNLKKLSRNELKSLNGGLRQEKNCTCGAGSSIEIKIPADSAADCFKICAEYRCTTHNLGCK